MLTTTLLDSNWLRHPRSIAAALLESDGHTALLDPGPASTLPALQAHLAARSLSIADLDTIFLTHIHLDHAGATGTLVRENPSLRVYVHSAGAPHLADPAKLLASAERLWPGQLNFLFGETLPVPSANLYLLNGGETLAFGDEKLRVLYTPGHASHHVSYFEASNSTAFVGDTAGFFIEGATQTNGVPYPVPVVPPPDIDLALWDASLDALAALRPARLFVTHFGYANNPQAVISAHRENLHHWAELAAQFLRSHSDPKVAQDAFIAAVTTEIRQRLSAAEAEHCLFNVGLNLSWLGLARYHRKRAEALTSPSARTGAAG